MESPADREIERSDEGPSIRVLLTQQNALLKDIHVVATALQAGFTAVITVAKFLTWTVGLLATIGGAIGLVKLFKGG